MSTDRLTRVNEILKQEVATALFRVMNEQGFDLSAVTVTRVVTGSDLRTARVMVSIRDHRQERQSMLNRLRQHRGDIQEQLNRHLILKYTPRLSFELDESIEEGDRILKIISDMEAAAPSGPEVPPAGEDAKPTTD